MQFLDLAGVRSLWDAIKVETAKSKTTLTEEEGTNKGTAAYVYVKGAAVEGTDQDGHVNYVVELRNAASNQDVQDAKEALYGGTIPATDAETITSLDQRIDNLESGSAVTITESAGSGDVLKVYTFRQGEASEQNPDSNIIGTVNIPKDFLVKSGQVREATAADTGFDAGTKILDFTVNSVDGQGSESHILIAVSDLVDTYTAGNGIAVSDANVISAVVDPAADNEFLSVSATGLKVSGVSTAISDAVNAAKTELKGTKAEGDTTAETIRGAKDYADALVAAKNVTAEGDSYVSATAANNKVTVAATQATKDSLALADSSLQGVDTTQKGTNVKVTLGTSGKNVTVAVDETALDAALAGKVDKVEGSSLMTQAEHDKLAAIEANADVNIIETVKVDNVALTPDANKAVNINLSGKADKVASATAGNLAALDANGNLTDSGKKAADFATAADGELAKSAIQSVTGETDITGGNDELVAVTASTNASQAVTLASKVKTQAIRSAVADTADGLATAADVKSYVDDKTTIAAHTETAAAPSETTPTGTMVVSSVTTENGGVTAVGSVEVETVGAAAAAEARLRGASDAAGYVANDTLAALRNYLNAMGGDAGSIAQQIQTEINKLDSDVNAATATDTHITSTNTDTETNAAETPVANVLTSLTITDGKISAATAETIGAIPTETLQTIFV